MSSSVALHERPLKGVGASSITVFPHARADLKRLDQIALATPFYPRDPGWPASVPAVEAEVIRLVNDFRVSNGLHALGLHAGLVVSARWKAPHTANYGYMDHADPPPPVARSVYERLADSGYPAAYQGWGENLAYGYPDPDAVFKGWYDSLGHRQNMLGAYWTVTGAGAAKAANGTWYWCQNFGTGAATDPPDDDPPPPPPPPPPVVKNTEIVAAALTLLEQWKTAKSGSAARTKLWAKIADTLGRVKD